MLNKGGELFEFMGELFKYMKTYFDKDMTDDDWKDALKKGDELVKKYSINPMCKTFCLCMVHGFLEFLSKKANENYD